VHLLWDSNHSHAEYLRFVRTKAYNPSVNQVKTFEYHNAFEQSDGFGQVNRIPIQVRPVTISVLVIAISTSRFGLKAEIQIDQWAIYLRAAFLFTRGYSDERSGGLFSYCCKQWGMRGIKR